MIHLQVPSPDWLEAVKRLPDRALVKAVDQGQVFSEVKIINPQIYTCLRHHYDRHQRFGGSLAENRSRARAFFDSFVDQTFIEEIAPYCDFVEEWNEYLADSQNERELSERATWAAAAAEVWHKEYRSRPSLAHIRLVLCNTAVGNWIPRVFFLTAQKYDCLIGYHPYIHCYRGVRSKQDWSELSGLFQAMEQAHKIKVDFIFTEAGPFESAVTGWKSAACLNGSIDSYCRVVRGWISDLKQTAAYHDGRLYGFALFTTGRAGSIWRSFWTEQPELNLLAEMVAEEWNSPVKPPGDPASRPYRGQPRLQYRRTVNVIPESASQEEAAAVFAASWRRGRETVTGSYDDAGVGDLDFRRAVLYGIQAASRERYMKWYAENYPGVEVHFTSLPEVSPQLMPHGQHHLLWPVDNETQCATFGGQFDIERSYGRHEGIDLFADPGDSILAVADGTIVWADSRRRSDNVPSDYGNHVVIDHGRGFISWYGHLDRLCVLAGDRVIRGDQIGTAGSSGNATGPHLHFSLQFIGRGLDGYVIPDAIDPGPYLGL